MNVEIRDIEELIAESFTGELTESDSLILNAWLNETAANRRKYNAMWDVWLSAIAADNTKNFDKDAAYARFVARTNISPVSPKIGKRITPLRLVGRIAAVAAILVAVAYISFKQGKVQVMDKLADITIEAPLGSITKTYLPDGTLVWLNAGSVLTYSQGFGVSKRDVTLEGEGYFEVTHNEAIPFNVYTDEMAVRVLGTKFNVRNYPEDVEVIVNLIEGKVLASNLLKPNDEAILLPNQKITLDKGSGKSILTDLNEKSDTAASNVTEWTKGELYFDEELLHYIVKSLERSYGVDIMIADPALNNLRFYANLSKKDMATIHDALDVLASTGKLKYEIDGKTVTLSLP
jgi:ferric-dicitrate binding protein FerR (iron transport regulator)